MKIIALEEHFQIAAIKKAVAKFLPGAQDTAQLASYGPPNAQLEDLGTGRLKVMDAMGIDVQVLSYPSSGIPLVPASEAVPLARETNDQLATAIATHPDRFLGLATLPTPDPEAVTAEVLPTKKKSGMAMRKNCSDFPPDNLNICGCLILLIRVAERNGRYV